MSNTCFNWNIYLKNYPDLKYNNVDNEEKAYKHYLEHGQYEDRVYYDLEEINEFDWITYLNKYPDLKEHNIDTKDEVINHYLNKGIKEGRIFFKYNDKILPNDFNWLEYINLYDDLKNYIKTEVEAINHYLDYGRKENRKYKIYSKNNQNNNIYHLDWIKYIHYYNNLGIILNNREEVIKHICINKSVFFNIYDNPKPLYDNDVINKLDNNLLIDNNLFNNNLIINDITFIIVTTKYGLDIYKNFKNMLDELNIKNKLIYDLTDDYLNNNEDNHNEIHVIFFPHLIKRFPKKYIIYQLEQVLQSNYINTNTLNIIKNSIITFDYSEYNIYALSGFKDNDLNNKIKFLPIPINKNIIYNINEKDICYDILFFGGLSYRRRNILNKLSTKFNILNINNKYGDELIPYIKKSKIILNIHYYSNYGNLEVPRINEILVYNKIIISESGLEMDNNYNIYKNNVVFLDSINNDLSNIDIYIDKINYFLNNDNSSNYLKNCNNELFIKNIYKLSSYYLKENINYFAKYYKELIFNKKIAVITSNFGNYDINEMNILNIYNYDMFNWFYFTDTYIQKNGWFVSTYKHHLKYIENINILNNDLNRLLSKFYKFQLLNIELFENYEYIIWLDSSIVINNKNFTNNIINIINNNNNKNNKSYDLFIFEHYKRANIKDELLESVHLNKYKNQKIVSQVKKYLKSDNYIDNQLYESGFMIYKNNNSIKNMMNDWWNEIINYSYQCQISLPYVIKKNNINVYKLNENNFIKGYLDGSVWRNNLYGYVKFNHSNNSNNDYVIDYNKINLIDYIVINYEDNQNIKYIYENINIHKYFINRNNTQYKLDFYYNSINYLKNINGNYFLICDEYADFKNMSFFEEDLSNIINNSPIFDILVICNSLCLNNSDANEANSYLSDSLQNIKNINNQIFDNIHSFIVKKNIISKINSFYNNDICDINIVFYKYNFINLNDTPNILSNIDFINKINKFELNKIMDNYFL
jgi:hypothetical protein